MFKLITIQDTILVPPHLFGQPRLVALEHAINKRFSDRVIPHYGLCVALWDWVDVSEDRLIPHSGDASTLCTFRMVVFSPFPGEVLFSRINASHDTGLYLEMGFFDAIHVRKEALPNPSTWDASEKVWVWKPEVGGGELFMDVSNECVFRCVEVVYEERMKVRPTERDSNAGVMTIWGSIHDKGIENSQGLGDPLWWEDGEEAEEEGGQEGYGEEGEYDQEAKGGEYDQEGAGGEYDQGGEGGDEEEAEGGYREGEDVQYGEGAEAGYQQGVDGEYEEEGEARHEEVAEGEYAEEAEGGYDAEADIAHEQVEEGTLEDATGGQDVKGAGDFAKDTNTEIHGGVNTRVQAQDMGDCSGKPAEDASRDIFEDSRGLIGETSLKPKGEAVIKEESRQEK
eukprot:GFKZ01015196.1.p1 GENE.GFKZ01015196.1~~GFKZ01015196.1.p1  ORF type:complete len:396 (-),score=76.65 GFKZ01015196.1:42-1229(-)